MKTPQQKLEDHLEIDGWDIKATFTSDLEWWADEIWELSSRWSPTNTSAFITFLVDPMSDRKRKKGQEVWGIGCSHEYPMSREQAELGGTISLKSGIRNEIDDFLIQIEKLRSCGINDLGL